MVLRRSIFVSACCLAFLRVSAAPAAPAAGTASTPAVAVSSSDKMSGLLSSSPFGNGKSGVTAAGAGGEAFEFRAILEEGGSKFFSIYEASSRKSNWVELNDPVNGFSVKSYDAAKETISLDYQGRSMTLAIKRAPAVAQALQQQPMLPPTNNAGMPVVSNNNPTAPGVPTAMDQQRIQQIQEEIRRRRALRSQGNATGGAPGSAPLNYGNGPQPMPSTGPGPIPQPSTGTGPQAQPSTSPGPQMIPPRT